MATVKTGDTVSLHYTGTLNDGSEFDSSVGGSPLSFKVGAGQVIPGFDAAVTGMAVGEKKTVTIPADEAYGEHNEAMVQVVPRDQLPDDMPVEEGMQVQAETEDGQLMVLTIIEFDDETVTMDANHPLAGEDLTFALEIVSIG
ncbi:FKBP-type peptidyl-prolyl cis-trans isomerase [Radicibacter daui]|uniref:FKBP-type peptidyl-prolyl cis-trans isomerase n=1 Tax=Radicibacter daui TaxID=3064829 RepID=UPI004046ABB9